jgi:hypothetical protein
MITEALRMNDPAEAPIFVVGAPRSGTTLLQRMLRSHPEISSPTGESHFVVPLLTNAASYGDLSRTENISAVLREMYRISADFLDTDLHGVKFNIEVLAESIHHQGASTMPQVIDALFHLNAAGEDKPRWLDKTPYYILHIPLLAAIYPDAQFVHIIRDGRDAALSMLERDVDIRVFSFFQAAKLWKRYVDAGRSMRAIMPPGRYLEFRFEDMLNEQEATMRQVCAFLRVEFSEKVIDFQKSRDPLTKTPLLKTGLKRDNQQKWREQMTPRQIRSFESVAGSTLTACGYPLVTSAEKPGFLARLFWYGHNQAMQRMHPHPRNARSTL